MFLDYLRGQNWVFKMSDGQPVFKLVGHLLHLLTQCKAILLSPVLLKASLCTVSGLYKKAVNKVNLQP